MQLRLQKLLIRLGELKQADPPTRHDLAQGTGIDTVRLTKIISLPQSKLSQEEAERIIGYLMKEFRPLIANEISDEQLRNQLCFDLFDFEHKATNTQRMTCPFSSSGKHPLKVITS